MLERLQVVDWHAHKADPSAHHKADYRTQGGSGGVYTAQVPIDQPDLLGTALAPVLDLVTGFAPNGIAILTVKVLTSEDSTYSVTFQIRDTTDDSSPATIATVATAASTEAETSVLTNNIAILGQKIYAVLPATDVGQAWVVITFTKI